MTRSLKTVLSLLLSILPFFAFAQKEGYLKTREIVYYGALFGLEKPDTASVVFQFNNGNKKTFTPEEALEFGLADGRKWVSRSLDGKQQFFEEMETGKATLLFQKQSKDKSFLLEKEGKVISMTEENDSEDYYKDVLSTQLADCYLTEKTIKLAKYKAANLKYFVSQFNDCLHKPFPKFRIGPVVGVRIYENVIKSKFFPDEPEKMVTVSFGAIVEIPISYRPQILLVTQPMVAFHSFEATNSNYSPEDATTSYNTHYLKHTDLDIPIMLKYRFANYKFSPYVQAGPALQVGLSTEAYSISDKVKFQNGQFELIAEDIYVDSGALANKYFGVAGGAGVEIPINPYITSVVGVNYSIYTADVDTGTSRKSYPEVFIGVTF